MFLSPPPCYLVKMMMTHSSLTIQGPKKEKSYSQQSLSKAIIWFCLGCELRKRLTVWTVGQGPLCRALFLSLSVLWQPGAFVMMLLLRDHCPLACCISTPPPFTLWSADVVRTNGLSDHLMWLEQGCLKVSRAVLLIPGDNEGVCILGSFFAVWWRPI